MPLCRCQVQVCLQVYKLWPWLCRCRLRARGFQSTPLHFFGNGTTFTSPPSLCMQSRKPSAVSAPLHCIGKVLSLAWCQIYLTLTYQHMARPTTTAQAEESNMNI